MKIRLHGKLEDMNLVIKTIKEGFNVITCAGPYFDRGDSKLCRFYLEAELLETISHAEFERQVKKAWEASKNEGLI